MVRLRFRDLLTAAGALLALAGSVEAQLPADAPDSAIAVVANAGVPARALSRAELRRIYLLRQRYWRTGARVEPVNLPAASALRTAFSKEVLGRSPRELASYWNDLYFHGTEPPPTLDSEQAVLLYVARTDGALGYVHAATLRAAVAAGVKLLLLLPVAR